MKRRRPQGKGSRSKGLASRLPSDGSSRVGEQDAANIWDTATVKVLLDGGVDGQAVAGPRTLR